MEHLQLGNDSFPLTFAGLNMLAKYIVNYYVEPLGEATDNFDRVNTQNNFELTTEDRTNIFRYCVISELQSRYATLFGDYRDLLNRVANYLFRKIRVDFTATNNLYLFRPWNVDYLKHLSFSNIIHTYASGYMFKDQTFMFDGKYFPLKFKRYLRTCDYCGRKYFDQDALLEDFSEPNSEVPNYLIGYDGECNDCTSRHYTQCDICGCFSDDCEEAVNTGDYVCYDCRQNGNFVHCAQCGDLIDCDDSYEYSNQFNEHFCSSDCAEAYGLQWNEDEEDWCDYGPECDEVDDVVSGYHSHSFHKVGKMRKGQKHWICIGRETEVDGANRYDFSRDWFEGLYEDFENNCVFETDGSLDSGFEIISQPMTEKAFFNMKWEKGFKTLVSNGFRSHETSTCGEHFHISKWALGYTYTEQFNNAKKVIAFFEKNWKDLVKLSRRDECELNWCRKFGFVPDKNTEMEELSCSHSKRYYAVNLEHLNRHKDIGDENGTIEIRLFKGTLNPNTMLADADFCLKIIKNAKRISWKNINKLKLWFKGLRPNTIEHIKARGAFEGAF